MSNRRYNCVCQSERNLVVVKEFPEHLEPRVRGKDLVSAEFFPKKVAKANFQLAEFVSSFEGNSNCCMVVPMVL